MSRHFYITDVFAEGPYAGNQLATLPAASDLSGEEMQQIARAFNFAETTFIVGGSLDTGFDVRIFTPVAELPFAGHPTIGTSYLIRNEIIKSDVSELTLNLGVGPIKVVFADDGVIWMRQNAPVFGQTMPPEDVAYKLGIATNELVADLPCQFVSTGLEFLIVPVASYETLKQVRVKPADYPIAVFCQGGYTDEQAIRLRMFAGALGVSEDPATGSANGCLAAYLSEHEVLGNSKVEVKVGQGYEINRPSQLYLMSRKDVGEITVDVGGKVNLVAEGEWKL